MYVCMQACTSVFIYLFIRSVFNDIENRANFQVFTIRVKTYKDFSPSLVQWFTKIMLEIN